MTLQLNVDFSDVGVTPSGFGDLQLVGAPFGAQTVRDLLLVANQMLGGDFTTFDTTLNDLVSLLNQGFDNCYPSGWVQDHLHHLHLRVRSANLSVKGPVDELVRYHQVIAPSST